MLADSDIVLSVDQPILGELIRDFTMRGRIALFPLLMS